MATVDTTSPPRSWLDQWVHGARTQQELRQIIMEQQDRLDTYVRQIEALEKERNEILRWQVESTYQDMMQKAIIQRFREALQKITKMVGSQAAVVADEALQQRH